MTTNENIILMCDSYKASHFLQYPPETEETYFYIESRGGKFDTTLFFGLQMFLKKYFSIRVTQAMVDEAADFFAVHGEPFNRDGWEYIVNKLDGKLPLEICALPEGLVVPTHTVLMTVRNTDKNCAWLPGVMETILLQSVWYPTVVATQSYKCKQIIMEGLEKSSDAPAGQIGFKLHDFGYRGVSSQESAGIGGVAHLVNFMGTDTIPGVLYAKKYYNEPMAGVSIPAAEHSTITSWGLQGEERAYQNMLEKFAKPNGILAVVSDSYDLMNAVNNIWGSSLKSQVENSGATIVIRPDSGNPLVVPIEVIEALGNKFGYTVNSKGYKVLPACVRVIQGDGITIESLPIIIKNLLDAGWSLDNLAFGMGGGLLQMVNRDTLRFAMKLSAIKISGVWHDAFKDPITDPGKKSKKGRFVVTRECNDKWETLPLNSGYDWANCLYVTWRDGDLKHEYDFSEIRKRSNSPYLG